VSGKGSYTIILEAGAGDDMTEWKSSLSHFEQYSQVFTYNRAGFKGSDSLNKKRDAQVIAIELRELLKEANIPPPYILAGHSLGGLYLRVFATTFPDEIAAVIQIDSTHHEMIEKCKDSAGNYYANPTGIPWWAFLILPNAVEEESKGLCRSLDIASETKFFPKVPLVVISSDKVPNGIEETSEKWAVMQSQQKYLATISPTSKHITCKSCGHYVHQDKPELIDEALKWIFEQL
jgi:pimeloyl-ACP methyl ester carboxylesterase